ncbi:uncharacterized protein LOC110113730, partial [Dendrobium catenatum]|uniref:uncharacterized protein LOC110113730 n=1 Tax=Dendrobium catenatum TaxID=906689 RepID=UPI0009F1CF95
MSSIGFWNCRGVRKKATSLYAKEFIRENDVFFLGLSETKLMLIDNKLVEEIFGDGWDFFFVPSDGLSGAATNIVLSSWKKNAKGDPAQILNQKMKRVLRDLHYWSRSKFKDINLAKDNLQKEIITLQEKEGGGVEFTSEEQWRLKACMEELSILLNQINTIWKQRAKIKWLSDGDSNTRFYHAFANARRNSNYIHSIKSMQGDLVEDQEGIEEILFQFFNIKWKKRLCVLLGWPLPNSVLVKKDKEYLRRKFSIEELEKVIKELGSNISPGQDVYKIAAKIILNRILNVAPKLISNEQVAFLKGRSISDHVLVAHDIFHKFRHSKSANGLVSLKIDMEQAYDSMGWPTLNKALRYFGFPDFFADLVMECVIDPSFSLVINGICSKRIEAKSGFRQGCPLSPFLFVLCAQLLTNAFYQRGKSIGISVSARSPKVSHLLYADDILVFSEAKLESINLVKKIIMDFCDWTDQKVNFQKSGILFGKHVNRRKRWKICKIIKFKELQEFNYLGTKMALRRMKGSDFQFILDNALKKIVPKRIMLEIEKACRKFIWSKGNREKGLHYISWDTLCKPKKVGEDSSSRTGSTAYKLIKNGGKFLKPIIRWEIGKGNLINVVKDTWIYDKSLLKCPTFTHYLLEDNYMVEDFIKDGRWDVQELQKFFGAELMEIIRNVHFNESKEDRMELILKFLGKSLTSLACEVLENCYADGRLQEFDNCPRGCGISENTEHIISGCGNLIKTVEVLNFWGF